MKKLSKILLPITSVAATAAPTICMASCSGNYFKETTSYFTIDHVEAGWFIPVSYGMTKPGYAEWETQIKSITASTLEIAEKISKVDAQIVHTAVIEGEESSTSLQLKFYFNSEWQPKKGDELLVLILINRIVDGKTTWSKQMDFHAICEPDL